MIFIGLDPGSRFFGYSVLVFENGVLFFYDIGVVQISGGHTAFLEFCCFFRSLLIRLSVRYPFFRIFCVIERQYLGKCFGSVSRLMEIASFVTAEMLYFNVDFICLFPSQARKMVLGDGALSKVEISQVLSSFFPHFKDFQLLGDDETDALLLSFSGFLHWSSSAKISPLSKSPQ